MKRVLAVFMTVGLSVYALGALASEAKHAAKAPVTFKGEIVDSGCYLSHGAKGADHKECATKCISGGTPMGLLTADNKFYLLTPNHKNADPFNQCKDLAASMVEVTGVPYTKHGVTMIDVTAVKAAAN